MSGPSVSISSPEEGGAEDRGPAASLPPPSVSLPPPSVSLPPPSVSLPPPTTSLPPAFLPPPALPPAPSRSSLGVPQQIKSSIGINNPLNSGGLNKSFAGGLGVFPLPNSQQVAGGSATGNPRNKVALAKGCSMMDWIRLTKSGKDLTGVGGSRVGGRVREVSKGELRKHKSRRDAWMAINGAVYNVTQYMDYHPGGWDELVRGAGRDATDMFNEIHRWVNYQGLLEACLVGKLVDGPDPAAKAPPAVQSPAVAVLPPIPSKPPTPTMDHFQTDSKLTVNIYTKRKGLTRHQVTVDSTPDTLRVLVLLPDTKEAFLVHLKLSSGVVARPVLRVGASSGKVEVELVKESPGRWASAGSGLEQHLWCGPSTDLEVHYRPWRLARLEQLTSNIKLMVFCPPPGTLLSVPPGHHVHVRAELEGVNVVRSYTPVIPLTPPNPDEEGWLYLMVKIYPMGTLTPFLGDLVQGDSLQLSDHTGDLLPSQLAGRPGLLLLAAGTGITPMLSILPHLAAKNTTLLFFNRREEDIPWREELDCVQDLKVVHVLSDQENFNGLKGRVRKELLAPFLSSLGSSGLVLVCGPPGFSRETKRLLREDCFKEEQIHLFEG